MKKITEVTRRDILDILINGIVLQREKTRISLDSDEIYHSRVPEEAFMPYCGCLSESEFLKRLYDLSTLPSYDPRFKDAEGDIWQHTENNEDWEYGWVFTDDRFQLSDGDDKFLLDFICQVFHPAVRNERLPWIEFYNRIDILLKADGYELYDNGHLSGRVIYAWRLIGSIDSIMISQSDNIVEKFDTEYVRLQVNIMRDMIYIAPHTAIGKAKELIEMCCKTILDEKGIKYQRDMDLSQLMRKACDSIDLDPKRISEEVKGKEAARRILGNLANMTQGMAELRNIYGDGHGRNRNFKALPPRYASLAVGSAVAAVSFLWDTYLEREETLKS